jgi:hypothetical protein
MPATDALTIRRARITTRQYRTTSPRLRATMLGARITTRRARITIHRAHGTTRRRRTMVRTTSPSPRPRATIRRARTITRHPRATIRHVRILVHDAKETRLLPARIRTTKRLDRFGVPRDLGPGGCSIWRSPRGGSRSRIRHLCVRCTAMSSKSSDRKEMHWGKRRAATPVCRAFAPAFGSLRQRAGGGLGAISVSLLLTFGIEPRPAERITGEHRDARDTALG